MILIKNKIIPLMFIYIIILLSCTNADSTLSSKNYSDHEKINLLQKKIDVKSPIEWTEFELYDVNTNNRSIPGPSNKDYKIVIKIDPKYINLWIKDKQNWITSFPHNNDWKNEILNKEQLSVISNIGYMTYYNEETGYKYTLWVNNENGVILIRFIQE